MKFIHIVIILILIFFTNEFVLAQSTDRTVNTYTGTQPTTPGARDTAGSENKLQKLTGIVSLGFSTYLAVTNCTTKPDMLCAMGIMGGVQSLSVLGSANGNTNPSRDPLNTDYPTACQMDPSLCATINPPTNPGDISSLPPDKLRDIKNLTDKLAAVAQTQGVDINDPNSVAAYNKKMEDAGYTGGPNRALGSLTTAQQESIARAKKEASKYSVSGVELEDGGGGNSMLGKHGTSDREAFDINSLLKGLDGKDNREPTSAGLQKNLGGEPIGVASDDIFKQVTRRYQLKIQQKSFLGSK